MSIVRKENILVPQCCDFNKWSVVACDQYTSQIDYWDRVTEFVGDSPSTLNLVYPEAYLDQGDKRIEKINKTMKEYLDKNIFKTFKDCLIYVERTLTGGRVRKGIVASIDLEMYDFKKGSKSAIRATEGTVIERIPPRVKIRENAPLELPHVLLLVDDKSCTLIEKVKKGEKIYDFELMENGGHIVGWMIKGADADDFLNSLDEFSKTADDGLVFAVGDGNHSLATAKTCWENIKATLSDDEKETHLARFCLVEIENIHDEVIEFEPIHRVVFDVDENDFLEKFKKEHDCGDASCEGQHIVFVNNGEKTDLYIGKKTSPLEVGTVQNYLDSKGYEVDYIHGEDVVCELSLKKGTVGILLPVPEKSSLFETVIKDGALPRKTFSMGEANEKRFYLEAKKIVK